MMYLADNKRKIIGGVILAVVLGSITFSTTLFLLPGKDYYTIRIVDKVSAGATMETYAHKIADAVKEVFDLQNYWNVKVEVTVLEPISFQQVIFDEKKFDIAIVELNQTSKSPDISYLFSENGTMNIFGISPDVHVPYGSETIGLLNEFIQSTNISDYTYYGDFGMTYAQVFFEFLREHVLDKMVSFLPLFCPKIYEATWSNLNGYDSNWGVIDSLPYMFFDGLHTGQNSINELRLFEETWKSFNPTNQEINTQNVITNLISEPIVKLSPGGEPLKTGLVEDWAQINESHFQFQLRDNVYWNPSYEINTRTENSSPLDPLSSNLTSGLKGEASNGSNQRVTANDIIFTLLAKGNPIVSDFAYDFNWVRDIWVDPIDDLSFHIVVDGDSTTSELEPWGLFWSSLETLCLPEFFLNSTSSDETLSSSGKAMKGIYEGILETTAWQNYELSPFGCGKYMIDYYDIHNLIVLKASPYWFEIGAKEGIFQELDIASISVLYKDGLTNALDEFELGNIDIVDVTTLTEERKQMQNNVAYEVHDNKLSKTFSFVAINLLSPLLGGDYNFHWMMDVQGKEIYSIGIALRKAIFYAINRVQINEEFHNGEYYMYDTLIHPSLGYWHSTNFWEDERFTLTTYSYNMTLAETWMSAAVKTIMLYDEQSTTT